MASPVDVASAVAQALPALDEDLQAYIASVVEEAEGDADAPDTVLEFVNGSGCFDDDEDAAAAAVKKLFEILSRPAGDSDPTAAAGTGAAASTAPGGRGDDTPKLLASAVTLGESLIDKGEAGTPVGSAGAPSAAERHAEALARADGKTQRKQARKQAEKDARDARDEAKRRATAEEVERQIREASGVHVSAAAAAATGTGGASGGGAAASSSAAGAGAGAGRDASIASGGARGVADTFADIKLNDFDLPSHGGGPDLLSGATLTLASKRRYGLVGRNGCGKSTLLSLLARRAVPGIPRLMSLTLVRQEIMPSDTETALSTVMAADMTRDLIVARVEALTEASKRDVSNADVARQLADASAELAVLDATSKGGAEARAVKILTGLGFTAESRSKPTRDLSGGWRMRVSLAAALFAEPQLLLLDEPTNHLDLESVVFLADYLVERFAGTLLVVSHDRAFLDAIVTDVIHFHNGTLKQYRGDISSFDEVRRARKAAQARQREAQEMRRAHMQEYITKHAELGSNGPKAAAQRKSRMKKMERLGVEAAGEGKRYKASYDAPVEEVSEVEEDEDVTLSFPDPGTLAVGDVPLLQLSGVAFTYPARPIPSATEDGGVGAGAGTGASDRALSTVVAPRAPAAVPTTATAPLLSGVDFAVRATSRVALLGRNGSGKSTLLSLAMGKLTPTAGAASLNRQCRIAYLAQHQIEQLDLHSTPLDFMKSKYPSDGSYTHEQALRRHLAKFGLGGSTLPTQRVYTLSGGQRCRLCLADLFWNPPHVIVLDEPTNHLDQETIDALIAAIDAFKGGVLVVSHDEYLLSAVCKELWVVADGAVRRFAGGFADYKKKVLKALR